MDEARPGNLEIWDIWDLQKSKKYKFSIKVRVAQNVGTVWISWKKLPSPFGALPGNSLRGPEKSKIAEILPIFLGGPMGPIHKVCA